uniref:Uncharacterized protein n=1 Tax=Octopus bimaculoides TaxID=37653 RepID=A0A0L8H9F1_OCTBM
MLTDRLPNTLFLFFLPSYRLLFASPIFLHSKLYIYIYIYTYIFIYLMCVYMYVCMYTHEILLTHTQLDFLWTKTFLNITT